MDVAELQALLARVPAASVPPVDDELLASSVRYLASAEAARSVAADTYWPKWDSPWWHMLLLFELGEARRIPPAIVDRMVEGLDALPLHTFPIHEHDWPPDADRKRASGCHCALGCMHQVLTACGVDVAGALPWVEPWFTRYQLADGGANCDETAYLSGEPDASSMVAAIAPFEAMLARPHDAGGHLERAAAFLIDRRLVDGSRSRHNAEERAAAPGWLSATFPRFYFYDVLRGLAALVRFADTRGGSLPLAAVAPAAVHLATTYADGVVRVGRRGVDTHRMTVAFADGAWGRHPTTSFPLLDAVAVVGAPSAALTAQWTATRAALLRLAADGRVTA
jgi:hypothetical protein